MEERPGSRSSCSNVLEEPLLRKDSRDGPIPHPSLSKLRSTLIIASLTGITFSSSMSHGLLTVGLPYIAVDLRLPDHLLLWYLFNYPYIILDIS